MLFFALKAGPQKFQFLPGVQRKKGVEPESWRQNHIYWTICELEIATRNPK